MTGKITLNGQLSTGISEKLIPIDGSFIVFADIPSTTYVNGGQTQTITHTEEGYNCYLFYCPSYGIARDFFVYVKSKGVNTAELYIRNEGDEVTGSIGLAMWLCVPIADGTVG